MKNEGCLTCEYRGAYRAIMPRGKYWLPNFVFQCNKHDCLQGAIRHKCKDWKSNGEHQEKFYWFFITVEEDGLYSFFTGKKNEYLVRSGIWKTNDVFQNFALEWARIRNWRDEIREKGEYNWNGSINCSIQVDEEFDTKEEAEAALKKVVCGLKPFPVQEVKQE